MILINALGIRDSGGVTVLDRALRECASDVDRKYLFVFSENESTSKLEADFLGAENICFYRFKIFNDIHRLYVENVLIRRLVKENSVTLIYNFSGSASFLSNVTQLIKLHDLSFFCKSVDKAYFANKKIFAWLREVWLKRLVKSMMILKCDFAEIQSSHVKNHIEEYVSLEKHRVFLKSDIDISQGDFTAPLLTGRDEVLKIIFVVGPHFQSIHKNLKIFVQAMSQLNCEGVDFEILITLKREELVASKLWDERLDVKTKFMGYLPRQQIKSLFTGNSLLVSTSMIETLGLHVVEALQGGIPVLVPNERYCEAVYGPYVQRFETYDPKSLAICIQRFLNMPVVQKVENVKNSQRFLLNSENAKLQSVSEIFDSIQNH